MTRVLVACSLVLAACHHPAPAPTTAPAPAPDHRTAAVPGDAAQATSEPPATAADLAHTPIKQLEIKPGRQTSCAPGVIAVYVARAGLWLGTGTDPGARCFAATTSGSYDFDWLERQLHRYSDEPCKPAVEVAAERDVSYQDVIHAMDVSIKEGLADVDLASPAELPVALAAASAAGAPADCAATAIHSASGSAAPVPVPLGPPRSARESLKDAPVVIVTKTDVELGGKRIATVAALRSGSGVIPELARALPPNRADLPAILQADQDTPMAVVDRVMKTLTSSGYSNLLFAVKNK